MRANTLARLHYLYTLAVDDADKRSNIRCEARSLARKQGLPEPPAWAAKRKPGEPEPEPAMLTPEPPPEIPDALRTWRAAGAGRVVNVRRDGSVRLITFDNGGARQEAAFSDVRTAERALLLGVSWRSVAKATRALTASGRVPLPSIGRSA